MQWATEKSAIISQICFWSAIFFVIDAYILGIFENWMSFSFETTLAFMMLIVAYYFLTTQRVEERELAAKSVTRTRDEFIAKER